MVCRVTDWEGGSAKPADSDSQSILYDVPLYNQGQTNLCWAYCMVMRKSYEAGFSFSDEQISDTVNTFGWIYRFLWRNNIGIPFFLLGDKASIGSINDLYELLLDNGPLYAAYNIPWTTNGHVVLVTGVDPEGDHIYTINPWGNRGDQSFLDFYQEFASGNLHQDSRYQLYGVYIPFF